ncbi:hypothetical protein HMSSN036_52150 [Paenibacillus macerans]|nr:hypothetical protein HMSSN036_52150 [Paenibacillus macerans]
MNAKVLVSPKEIPVKYEGKTYCAGEQFEMLTEHLDKVKDHLNIHEPEAKPKRGRKANEDED